MTGDALRAAVIRLAVTVHRIGGPGEPWRAYLDFGDGQPTVFTAEGRPEADALSALADMIMGVLARLRHRPVIVIGGGADYVDCIHLILAEVSGWVVHVIRDGHEVGSWHIDAERDELLRQVLDHVGGQPTVVRL
ncbi:hypothetical protein AB0M46_05500 [Dactylosporangium sp. NPDC051485]|uniref:hypothetical protein n=1 Tax=Dactylosporangium sp. NPDC051485 TaxID=3154846 RepID=UPI003425C94F